MRDARPTGMKLVSGLRSKTVQWQALRHATQCFIAPNFPVYARVPHFSRRKKVCVYDGPRARITFTDKSHARFQFQRSIEPRYRMRATSFYFDLNGRRHHALSRVKMLRELNTSYLMVAGNLATYDDMSHSRRTATTWVRRDLV
jgi:hypothetical protein